MSSYVIVDTTGSGNSDSRATTDVQVIVYANDVVPVFTSPESFWEFVRAQHSAQDLIRPTPLELHPVKLAIMAERLQATADLKWLVFDPRISSRGWWILPQDPVSVNDYCRYILELALATKELFAEGRARFADECSSTEELDKMVRSWVALQVDKLEDESWRGGPDFPIR